MRLSATTTPSSRCAVAHTQYLFSTSSSMCMSLSGFWQHLRHIQSKSQSLRCRQGIILGHVSRMLVAKLQRTCRKGHRHALVLLFSALKARERVKGPEYAGGWQRGASHDKTTCRVDSNVIQSIRVCFILTKESP